MYVVVFADVDAIEQYGALSGVVQPAQQLDEGSLAAAVFPHHSQPLSHAELEADVPQRPSVGSGVAEAHIPKLHIIVTVAALLHIQGALVHLVGKLQKIQRLLQIGQIDL